VLLDHFLRVGSAFFTGFLVEFLTALLGGMAIECAGVDLRVSPSTDLRGHIFNTGHFWQPTAMAMGHTVIIETLKCN
jgi:hypothetical protein